MEMMGTGATSTVNIKTLTAAATSAMSMATSTSMAMSTSSMDMDMSMDMSMYLKTSYHSIPVIFKSLYATNKATAFAIFVILFCTAFAFRGVGFLACYIEEKIFQQGLVQEIKDVIEKDIELKGDCCGVKSTVSSAEKDSSSKEDDDESEVYQLRHSQSGSTLISNNKQRSVFAKFVSHTPQSLYQDFIRLSLAFIQILLAYALMLAVMTCVIPYFFAVVLGIAFGEVFFLRLGQCFGINVGRVNGSLH